MKTDFFNKLPAEAVKVVLDAYPHRSKGWTDTTYKAHYLAFQQIMGDELVPAEKFDAVVAYWGKGTKNPSSGYGKNKGRCTLQPNKMMSAPYTTKSASPLQHQSPLRHLYEAKDCVEQVGREMGAMWS